VRLVGRWRGDVGPRHLDILFPRPSGNYGDRLFVIFRDQADISEVVEIKDRDERFNDAYQN